MKELILLLIASHVHGQNNQGGKEKQYIVQQQQGRQLPYYGPAPFPSALNFDPYLNPQFQYGFYPGPGPAQGSPPSAQPNNQGLPIQPQVIYYAGGPGQPFLLNPGAPPGNFLIPQPLPHQPQPQPGFDPNIFKAQPFPQRPVFVAGYPKPAHIPPPPTEKDAEEIPTDPKLLPPQKNNERKPEKLIELDDAEPEEPQNPAKPNIPVRNFANLRPGQRFFILNGQPLFSNYPINPFQSSPERYNQFEPYFIRQAQPQPLANYKPESQKIPIQDFLLRNGITGQISNVKQPQQPSEQVKQQQLFVQQQQPHFVQQPQPQFVQAQQPQFIQQQQPQLIQQQQPHLIAQQQQPQLIPQQHRPKQPQIQKIYVTKLPEKGGLLLRDILPLQLHNQVVDKNLVPVILKAQAITNDIPVQSRYYEKGLPLQLQQQEEPLPIYEGNVNPGIAYDYYKYSDNLEDDNDAVVIDAKDNIQDDPESESVESESAKPVESSVAQAQPGAIALAGPGGVAAAGPRGTALAGEGGLAVSSPQATAVAGPKRDEEEQKKKPTKKQ